jgi:ankyrin repeat protein
MIGCQKGEIEIVSILIANGSLINELDNNGNSALHHSLDNNSESKADIIRILAEKKCQINQLNEDHVSLQGVTFNEISEIERLEIGILAY